MVNTNIHRHGWKRFVAFLLGVICALGILPMQVLALSPGQTASSWIGERYVGSDGKGYYAPAEGVKFSVSMGKNLL